METIIRLWQNLAQFFLEWETFQTKFVEKIKKNMFNKADIIAAATATTGAWGGVVVKVLRY